MKSSKIFLPILFSLSFSLQIHAEFASAIIAGSELIATVEPIVYKLGSELWQEAYPEIKKCAANAIPAAEQILYKIEKISEHEIHSWYSKKSKFSGLKLKTLTDKIDKFNLHQNYSCNDIKVDTSGKQSSYEQNYNLKRASRIKLAIENLTGYNNPNYGSIEEKDLPKIAFVFSGGGYRAMISSLGFMLGASKIARNNFSLIDATSYISSLSGSTWFLGMMLTLNNYMTYQPQTIQEYLQYIKQYLQQTTNRNFWDVKTFNLKAIEKHLWEKFLHNEGNISASDLWGALLADRLFNQLHSDGNEQEITFAAARNTLNNSAVSPFPIFSANICNVWPYEWLDVNPFTTGFIDPANGYGGFIPTSAFESPFNYGESKKLYPEESLGSFFGMFGSAYSVSLVDLLNDIAESTQSDWFKSFVNMVAEKTKLYKDHILRANVDNFMYQMDTPLGNLKKITLADAGISMINLPFPPLFSLKRDVDIFIVCDSSGDATKSGYPELRQVQDYATINKIKFPSLKNPKIYKYSTPGQTYKISVFEDESNPLVPTIIYFPNYIPESTIKFNYSEAEFENLCGTMENMVLNSQATIIDSIKNKIDAKSNFINNIFGDIESLVPRKGKHRISNFIKDLFCLGSEDLEKKYYSIN